jgi:hypothetical protein
LRRAAHPVERGFEPYHACEQLGTDTHLLHEPSLKLAEAQAGAFGHGGDTGTAGPAEDIVSRCRDSIARGRSESALKEELIGDRNALFESAAISKPFLQTGNDGTEHLLCIKSLVGELLRWQSKQEAER